VSTEWLPDSSCLCLCRRTSTAGSRVSPKEILDGRYARGEIATAEYEERLSHFVGD